jgi:hypothetical protein
MEVYLQIERAVYVLKLNIYIHFYLSCHVNPKCSKNSSCKFDPPHLFKIKICPRQYIGADVISANTFGLGEGEALPKIRNDLPIHQEI